MLTCFRAAAATVFLSVAMTGVAQTTAEGVTAFVAHADRPILTLAREHGMVRGLKERPFLYIFGDGRVRVERPAYMVNPGVFEYRLELSQLNELIATLDQDDVLTIDSAALSQERDAAARARRTQTGERFMTTDHTVTRITVDLASYARAGEAPVPLGNTITYRDVQVNADRFPQIPGLRALASTEKRLLAMMDHPDMVRVQEVNQ